MAAFNWTPGFVEKSSEDAVNIDWLTWSVFTIGAIMLLYWCVQTFREFRKLFRRRRMMPKK